MSLILFKIEIPFISLIYSLINLVILMISFIILIRKMNFFTRNDKSMIIKLLGKRTGSIVSKILIGKKGDSSEYNQ